MRTLVGTDGFRFLDEREMRLQKRWLHYSTADVFSQFFRSPDWLLWQDGRYDDAIRSMRAMRRDRIVARARLWAENGVTVTRIQVVDHASIQHLPSPVNYLLTYLAATHPDEDRYLLDSAKCATADITLPTNDLLLHDDDLLFTKYEGEPGVVYRDTYLNAPPANPSDDDDRPFFHHCANTIELLLARRDQLRYTEALPGEDLLRRNTLT